MQEGIHLNVFKEIIRRRILGSSYKRGFTLVEMIVVIVIIGIGASIAVPNFARMIERNEWRGFIQTAQNAENALMSLTGLQYANIGDPKEIEWPKYIDDSPEKQFVTIDKSAPAISGLSVFQVTVARSGSADQRSAGEQEFYKRTMIGNVTYPSWDGGPICAVYCNDAGLTGNFIRYEFMYSEYYMISGNRKIVVYHNARPDVPGESPGWHIFEKRGDVLDYVGSIS